MEKRKIKMISIILIGFLCIISPIIASPNFIAYNQHTFWIHPEQEKIVEISPMWHTDTIWLNFSMTPDFNLYIYMANEENYQLDNWSFGIAPNKDYSLFQWNYYHPYGNIESDETYYLKFKNVDIISSYMDVRIFIEGDPIDPIDPIDNSLIFISMIISIMVVGIIIVIYIVFKKKSPKNFIIFD